MDALDSSSSLKVGKDQLVAWPRVAAIAAMVSFSLPTFITGLEIYQGLTVDNAIWVVLIASLILTCIGAIMGGIGAHTRLSSYLLVRVAFGDIGAGFVNIAFALSLIGWFGVNIDLFASAVVRLAEDVFQIELMVWPIEVLAGICMLATTLYGFKAINICATLLVPVLAIITAMMFYQANVELPLSQYLNMDKSQSLSIDDGIAAIVGAIIIGTIILPDITRFSRTWQGGAYTAFWAYMVIQLLVLLTVAYAAAAIGQVEILELMLVLGLGLFAFFIVIGGSWILNSLNLYSTVLSVEATFPKLKGNILVIVLGAIGIVAAFFNILDYFITFLVFLAAIFVPVAGIIMIDFFVLNKSKYTLAYLENNKKLSLPALAAWAIGCIPALFTLPISLTQVNVLDAILFASISYLLLVAIDNKLRSTSA